MHQKLMLPALHLLLVCHGHELNFLFSKGLTFWLQPACCFMKQLCPLLFVALIHLDQILLLLLGPPLSKKH